MIHRLILLLVASLLANQGVMALADTVYFVSKTTGGLYTMDTTGGGITAISAAGTFSSPSALALGPDGNLYVGDMTNGGSISRYTIANGSVSTVVTLSGTSPTFEGGPVSPTAIAFTPGGSLLVGRNPESQFTGYPGGQVLEVVGWNGGSPGVQNYTSGTTPKYQTGLAVAPNGTLYASNTLYNILSFPPTLTGEVLTFDVSGGYQSIVAADGSGTGGLSGPTGIGVFGNLLFIASAMNGNVYKTDLTNPNTATNTTVFASTGGDFVGPLAMLSDGSLLVGSVSGPAGLLYQFNPAGSLVNAFGGESYGQIGGIVAVPEPGAMILAVAGILSVGLARLRRRQGA